MKPLDSVLIKMLIVDTNAIYDVRGLNCINIYAVILFYFGIMRVRYSK